MMAKGFICERCIKAMKSIAKPAEELTFYDQVELVKSFITFLGDRLNASGESEAVVTPTTRPGWIQFGECVAWLNAKFMFNAFIKNKRMNLSKLCKVGTVVQEQDMESAGE